MIAVIFEAFPAKGKWDEYLDIAAGLRPELSKIEGFISIERFESISTPGKVLSLSFWKDEESVIQWRNLELHRQAQASGRKSVFDDYRLRVANVLRDYGMNQRAEAPADSKNLHDK
ncbi:antibiotic biosynthesis monooxygenase [Emticicia sp. CRIBPO]|uniref:antibiotic biosynthesis monooxygenase family protein n=1 Tax=Emticicia sp. CRIBPO TaxID=2683258 RepID=UPI001411BA87|nr:antibiotic biosynthesis monooxygenase [Emticicia sp. CRIBPO]NBA86484.1 antibiotic biosynthesis monooxygenase [Emticicia sp. CRIBPO]